MNCRTQLLAVSYLVAALCSANALASETSISPEALSDHSSAFGVGYGFHPQSGEFGFFQCVNGEISDQVVSISSEPFANPEIVISSEKSEVRVVFKAQSTSRRVLTLNSNGKITSFQNPKAEAVCGSQYVSEMQIGAKIFVARSFFVAAEDQARLASILKERLTDLRSLLQLDLSKDGLRLTGSGISIGGNGHNKELYSKMGKCSWMGQECDAFVEQAYADAAALDAKYPSGRVANLIVWGPTDKPFDGGDVISYKVKPYSK